MCLMFKCKYCGQEFDSKQQLGGHMIWCKENPDRCEHNNLKEYNECRCNHPIEDIPEEDKGKKSIMRTCDKHGYTEFTLRKDGVYRCKKCAAEAVQKRRRKLKEELVAYKGGKCEICGYDACIAALEFHHINPNEKEFGIGTSGVTKSLESLKKEADKCLLLCCNCHRELHWKIDNNIPVDIESIRKK